VARGVGGAVMGEAEMRVVLADDRCTLIHGDSARLGSMLDEHSVDAIVTDPPAGISFMGKDWDGDKGGRDAWIDWLAGLLRPALRALKPGGHALVWAIPRTSHWTAMALELAGFEIRDVHHHLFGTGFPKSLTSKSAPIPEGTGTAMKPAVEHWILARKPLDGTVGANFAEHGTGVLNIDACRIGTSKSVPASTAGRSINVNGYEGGWCGGSGRESGTDFDPNIGRWPAHLSLEHAWPCWQPGPDDYLCPICGEVRESGECSRCGTQRGKCHPSCTVRIVDEQSGETKSSNRPRNNGAFKSVAKGAETARVSHGHDDAGGASRFFYVAKGSRSEKDAGLDHLPPRTGGEATGRIDDSAGTQNPRAGAGRTGGARNFHPTVKSIDLMRWLVRLITPAGGVVLDMFAGSGTTGIAALAEGRRFIGCEMADEYIPIAVGRLQHALAKMDAQVELSAAGAAKP
jgi:site-specific DNA-methyltransferase (adenine-specific)